MRRHTASRDTPVAVHGRRNDSIASKSVRCDVHPPILFRLPAMASLLGDTRRKLLI